jgi:hypothetical protein
VLASFDAFEDKHKAKQRKRLDEIRVSEKERKTSSIFCASDFEEILTKNKTKKKRRSKE